MLENVLDFEEKKNIDVSNRYIGRHRCILSIYRIEKNIDVFSKWSPVSPDTYNIMS